MLGEGIKWNARGTPRSAVFRLLFVRGSAPRRLLHRRGSADQRFAWPGETASFFPLWNLFKKREKKMIFHSFLLAMLHRHYEVRILNWIYTNKKKGVFFWWGVTTHHLNTSYASTVLTQPPGLLKFSFFAAAVRVHACFLRYTFGTLCLCFINPHFLHLFFCFIFQFCRSLPSPVW